jgi:hypothetical protein
MLTYSDLLKAAKLRQQVGELRPGFIRDNDSYLQGPAPHYPASNAIFAEKKDLEETAQENKKGIFYQIIESDNGELICKRFENP